MKTIFVKTNPNFKRAQLLPAISDLLPPTMGGAARRYSELTPSQTCLRPPMTGLVVYVSSVNQGVGLPVVRSVN